MFDIYEDCLSLPSIKSSLIKDNLYVFHIIIDKSNPFIKMNEAFPKSRNSARWCLREKYSAFDCNNFNIDTIQISSKRGKKIIQFAFPLPQNTCFMSCMDLR